MRRLIDTHQGERDSLADVEEYLLLARGLAELEARSALLSDRNQSVQETVDYHLAGLPGYTQESIDELRRLLEAEPLLRPYDAFATGAGWDNRGLYMAVVLIHPNEQAAEENVGLLRRRIEEAKLSVAGEPWADFFDDMEIHAKGRVVLVKLWGEGTRGLWLSIVRARDFLLLHE